MVDAFFGEQVVGTLLGISFGLSRCWDHTAYQSKRRSGILDQEVDKFSLLLVHALLQADVRKAPLRVVPGRRGPGAALVTADGSPAYICDIIEDFQDQMPEEYQIFAVHRASAIRYFEPQVSTADWHAWTERAFATNRKERDFLVDFGRAVQELEQPQVIALGRHPNKGTTAASLRKLAADFRSEFRNMSLGWRSGANTTAWYEHLREGCEIAEVGNQKATHDRERYRQARKAVVHAGTSAGEAILGCRPSDDEIWEADIVVQLVPSTLRDHGLARVVRAAIAGWAKSGGSPEVPAGKDPGAELADALTDWDSAQEGDLKPLVDQLLKGHFQAASDALAPLIADTQRVGRS